MKILQVSPFDFTARGGVKEHVVQLDREFQRLGHDTRILAATSPEVGEFDDGHVYQLGIAIPIPSNGSTARVTFSPFVIRKIKAFLAAEKFDVIHLHEPLAPMLPLACLLHSKALNVGTFHAARTFNFWYHYAKAFLDMFFERLDVHIAVSEAAREFADNHFPAPYEIVPNGINLDKFRHDVTPVTEYLDGRKNILFVGRYDESRKGFHYLLRAMPLVQRQFPESRLIVVGRGDHRRAIEQARERGIRNVEFVGEAREMDIARYYATCDVFCAPSTGRESFGIVLLEALATGAPVVASDITGYAAVLRHGETGILVEPENAQELAMAIVRVLADTELRQKLVMNGLEDVKRYAWPRIAKRVLELYERGLGTGHPVRSNDTFPELLAERRNG